MHVALRSHDVGIYLYVTHPNRVYNIVALVTYIYKYWGCHVWSHTCYSEHVFNRRLCFILGLFGARASSAVLFRSFVRTTALDVLIQGGSLVHTCRWHQERSSISLSYDTAMPYFKTNRFRFFPFFKMIIMCIYNSKKWENKI